MFWEEREKRGTGNFGRVTSNFGLVTSNLDRGTSKFGSVTSKISGLTLGVSVNFRECDSWCVRKSVFEGVFETVTGKNKRSNTPRF